MHVAGEVLLFAGFVLLLNAVFNETLNEKTILFSLLSALAAFAVAGALLIIYVYTV